MQRRFEIYKNIPIGLIIKKDLRKRKMSQKALAHQIGMSYRSLNNAINGHRLFSLEEATKLDNFFDYEASFICKLQDFNFNRNRSIPASTSNQQSIIPTPTIRKCVFWDIDIEKIDWIKHQRFIVNRISIYGNQTERKAVEEYYKKIRNSLAL